VVQPNTPTVAVVQPNRPSVAVVQPNRPSVAAVQPNTPTVAVVQPNTPTVAAVQAPPTLFARALFPELLAIGEAQGAKEVARRHVGEAEVVTWPSAASRDIDVPADYDALRRGRRKD
jgi:CTP:molybdopterin cytidylyltransferase MocA